jgi:hypothetical protein
VVHVVAHNLEQVLGDAPAIEAGGWSEHGIACKQASGNHCRPVRLRAVVAAAQHHSVQDRGGAAS